MNTRQRLTLMLDSASLADASAASESGFVAAVTTNPTLMAREGEPSLTQLTRLLEVFSGPIFFQPDSDTAAGAEREVEVAVALDPGRVVVKLPARRDFFGLAARQSNKGAQIAITAVYSPAQALVACVIGAAWIIPYVNRARRLAPDGDDLVRRLAEVTDRSETAILAASIKSADEAVAAVADGADAVSAPLSVLYELTDHPLADAAIGEFAAARTSQAPGE